MPLWFHFYIHTFPIETRWWLHMEMCFQFYIHWIFRYRKFLILFFHLFWIVSFSVMRKGLLMCLRISDIFLMTDPARLGEVRPKAKLQLNLSIVNFHTNWNVRRYLDVCSGVQTFWFLTVCLCKYDHLTKWYENHAKMYLIISIVTITYVKGWNQLTHLWPICFWTHELP